MKNVDHSYEQALIMHDNLHIHVIMNIIVTPTTDQVHATVPLTNAESICIISVGPLPYVLYTAGKLVCIENGFFLNRGYILMDLSLSLIPRLRSTSSHLLPSLSLCSDLEQG